MNGNRNRKCFISMLLVMSFNVQSMEQKENEQGVTRGTLRVDEEKTREKEVEEEYSAWVLDDPTATVETDFGHRLVGPIYSYKPSHIAENSVVWLLVIPKQKIGDPDKLSLYQHVKKTAEWYSTNAKKQLRFLFYWSPEEEQERKVEGHILERFLDKYDSEQTADIVILGYDAGCHIASYLTHLREKPIKLLILFSCPKTNDKNFYPNNYEQLIYFDVDRTKLIMQSDEDSKELDEDIIYERKRSWDIGISMGLLMASILCHGTPLLQKTCPYITARFHLLKASNILTYLAGTGAAICLIGRIWVEWQNRDTAFGEESPADLIIPLADNKITVRLKVKLIDIGSDSYEADNLHKVSRFLPSIISQLQEDYPAHYCYSSTFDLAVDLKHNKDSAQLTIVDCGGGILPPDAFDYFGDQSLEVRKILTDDFSNESLRKETKKSKKIKKSLKDIK